MGPGEEASGAFVLLCLTVANRVGYQVGRPGCIRGTIFLSSDGPPPFPKLFFSLVLSRPLEEACVTVTQPRQKAGYGEDGPPPLNPNPLPPVVVVH
jgi:hypothetical protein